MKHAESSGLGAYWATAKVLGHTGLGCAYRELRFRLGPGGWREQGVRFARDLTERIEDAGIEVRFRGRQWLWQALESGEPVLILSNHASYADSALLQFAAARPLLFVAKHELTRLPGIAGYLSCSRSAVVDRSERQEACAEITRAAQITALERTPLLLFPQGRRIREVRNFKPAGVMAAAKELAKAPAARVVRVAISNAFGALQLPFQARRIGISFLKPTPIPKAEEILPQWVEEEIEKPIRQADADWMRCNQ